jgi:hypothetical protein
MPDDDVESPSLIEAAPADHASAEKTDELGSLSIEDNPEGTVDPADLAGTEQEGNA